MLEIRGAAPGLIDDPLLLEVGGAPPNTRLTWRARIRDDDGFVWRAEATTSEGLLTAWTPAKPTAGPLMALRSLRPAELDVRVEDPDGAAASRTITRYALEPGVRSRRWKGDIAGTLFRPAGDAAAGLLLDARPEHQGPWLSTDIGAVLDAAPLAGALLAARGILVFALNGGSADDPGAAALERLAQMTDAPPQRPVPAAEIGVPPGIAYRGEAPSNAGARAVAWDGLLERLGARPRRLAR